jgi:hypothetical protein
MIRMSEIQIRKKQNKKEMMGVAKALLVGAAMMLGLAATVGWLSQEAQAARCLDCDTRLENEATGAEPACPNGVFSCSPWSGGHAELTADEQLICPDCTTRPMPGLLTN